MATAKQNKKAPSPAQLRARRKFAAAAKARAKAARAAKRAAGIRVPRKNATTIKARVIKHLDVSKVHNPRKGMRSILAGQKRFARQALALQAEKLKARVPLYTKEGRALYKKLLTEYKRGYKLRDAGKDTQASSRRIRALDDKLDVLREKLRAKGAKANPRKGTRRMSSLILKAKRRAGRYAAEGREARTGTNTAEGRKLSKLIFIEAKRNDKARERLRAAEDASKRDPKRIAAAAKAVRESEARLNRILHRQYSLEMKISRGGVVPNGKRKNASDAGMPTVKEARLRQLQMKYFGAKERYEKAVDDLVRADIQGIDSGSLKWKTLYTKYERAEKEYKAAGNAFFTAKKANPRKNADHRDAQHPIHVTDYWQGRKGYKSQWQRAHEAGQRQLFGVKNPRALSPEMSGLAQTATHLHAQGLTKNQVIAKLRSFGATQAHAKTAYMHSQSAIRAAVKSGFILPPRDLGKRLTPYGTKRNASARRPNGSNTALAQKRRSEFVGRPSKKIITSYAPKGSGAKGTLAGMGKLKRLKIKGRGWIDFKGVPYLAHSPKKDRIFVLGKQYSMAKFKKRNPEGSADIGEVTHIEYEAVKTHLGDTTPIIYVHEFGEEGGERPHAIVNEENLLILEGGDYYITPEGIHD